MEAFLNDNIYIELIRVQLSNCYSELRQVITKILCKSDIDNDVRLDLIRIQMYFNPNLFDLFFLCLNKNSKSVVDILVESDIVSCKNKVRELLYKYLKSDKCLIDCSNCPNCPISDIWENFKKNYEINCC